MTAQQYAQILRVCTNIGLEVKALRKEIKDLSAMQAKTTTAIMLLKTVIEHGSPKD